MVGFLALIAVGFAATSPSQSQADPFLVVIDPGHGGQDHGAVVRVGGQLITEKDLALRLALQFSRELQERGIRSVLTRRTDRFISLSERTAIANRLGAKVFISLHMNSGGRGSRLVQGVETYILNNSSNASSIRLAQLENSVLAGSELEFQSQTNVALILKDLVLDSNLGESKKLACALQDNLLDATSNSVSRAKKNRGVRQALFHVLLGADMPSALVEAGFIDHPRDRDLVVTPEARGRMADALAQAVVNYKARKQPLSNCLVH